MKKLILALMIFGMAGSSLSAMTIRVYNSKSNNVSATARCSGSNKNVVFRSSTTASYTLHSSSSSSCTLKMLGSSYNVRNGAKVTIRSNGKVEIR